MAISGSLEDVSVADVMQFIHLGRRTGTLMLDQDGDRAMIGFHEGKLISAGGPSTPKLGDLLIRQGVLGRHAVDQAIEIQLDGTNHRSLGQILVAEGRLSSDQLRQVVSQQIEQTISDLVLWDRGTFDFIVDGREPLDDIALFPGEVVPDADINTQMVLLEAARIFDERNRDATASGGVERSMDETNPTIVQPPRRGASHSLDDTHTRSVMSAVAEEVLESHAPLPMMELGAHRIQIVTRDSRLVERLDHALPPGFAPVEQVPLEESGHAHPGHEPPMVVLDLRARDLTVETVGHFRRTRPGVPVVALTRPDSPVSELYQAGVMAAIPPEVDALVANLANLSRNRQRSAPEGGELPDLGVAGAGVARLRRVFGDLRSGLISATVALNLMHIISESVERAVLFLVKRDTLTALGAFGASANGKPLAEATRGVSLQLDLDNVLTESLETGQVISRPFAESNLPPEFARLVGAPSNGEIVIFPVLGAQRVISIIYTDNGENPSPIEDIDILELATAQVGMAFENELLRRQISQQG
jgi:hypothetical protein